MIDKDKIDGIYRDGFDDFELPVSDKLLSNIKQELIIPKSKNKFGFKGWSISVVVFVVAIIGAYFIYSNKDANNNQLANSNQSANQQTINGNQNNSEMENDGKGISSSTNSFLDENTTGVKNEEFLNDSEENIEITNDLELSGSRNSPENNTQANAEDKNNESFSKENLAKKKDSKHIDKNNLADKKDSKHLNKNKPADKKDSKHIDKNDLADKKDSKHIDKNDLADKKDSKRLDKNKPADKKDSKHIDKNEPEAAKDSKYIDKNNLSASEEKSTQSGDENKAQESTELTNKNSENNSTATNDSLKKVEEAKKEEAKKAAEVAAEKKEKTPNAAKEDKNKKSKTQFFVAVNGGPSLSYRSLTGSNAALQSRNDNEKNLLTYAAGLDFGAIVNNKLIVNIGVGLDNKGEKYSFPSQNQVLDTAMIPILDSGVIIGYTIDTTNFQAAIDGRAAKNKYQFLRIPVMVGYQFTIKDKWIVAPSIGVNINYLLSGNSSWVSSDSTKAIVNYTKTDFNKITFAGRIKLDIGYNVTEKFSITIQPGYTRFLQTIYRKDSDFKLKPYSYDLNLGLRYKF